MSLLDIRRISAVRPQGMSSKATKRLLQRLDAKHGGILLRSCESSHGIWLVNVTRLKAVRPQWDDRPYPTREEHEALRDRVAKVESHSAFLRKRQNALAKAFREAQTGDTHTGTSRPTSPILDPDFP